MAAATDGGETPPSQSEPPPLQSLFTLPFALRIQPLPHLYFTAKQSTANEEDSAELEAESSGSDQSEGSNNSGALKLKGCLETVPPHQLHVVSYLIANTNALQAVSSWSKLLALLADADDDPAFSNLRAFFDARFDREGNLIDDSSKSPRKAAFRRRSSAVRAETNRKPSFVAPSSLGRSVQRSRTGSSSFSAAAAASARGRSRFGLLGRALSRDEALDSGDEGSAASELKAPVLRCPPRKFNRRDAPVHGDRTARFRVRLDLHTVSLAPPPSVPKSNTRRPRQVPMLDTQILASPVESGHSAQDEFQRLVSPKSRPPGEMLDEAATGSPTSSPDRGLHRVVSPESVLSRSSLARSASPGQSPPSPRARGGIFGRKSAKPGGQGRREPSVASQNSQMNSLDRVMSQEGARSTATFGSANDGNTAALSTSPTNAPERSKSPAASVAGSTRSGGGRKMSLISRMFDLGKSTKKVGSTQDSLGAPLGTADGTEETLASSAAEPAPRTRAESSASLTVPSASLGRRGRRRTATVASNESEEEALDTADDDVGSAGASAIARWQRRRASAGSAMSNNPSGASGLAMVPDLQPLAEGMAWSQTRVSSSGIPTEDPPEREWTAGEDFLSLLRGACEEVLSVKPCSDRDSSGDSSWKGKAKEDHSSSGSATPFSSGAQTPVSAPPKPPDTDSWWLCGHTDPLTITLPCAFGEALGWEGIMQLCYGEGSQAARDQDFRPLGLAAHLDTAQQNEKSKVQNWARDVASTGTSPTEQEQQSIDGLIETALKRSEVAATTSGVTAAPGGGLAELDARSDIADDASDIAPSESASTKAVRTGEKSKGDSLLERLRKSLPTRSASASEGAIGRTDGLATTAASLRRLQLDGYSRGRTWEDWLGLARSIASWVEDYETDRVRSGLAQEVVAGQKWSGGAPAPQSTTDSGFHEPSNGHLISKYLPPESGLLPNCVCEDAVSSQAGFRRRAGVPPALTNAESGEEHMHYRWASSRLKSKHFASAITLGTASLVHMLSQVSAADWTHRSAWELDYLEACVFHAPLVAERFAPPGTSVIPAELSFIPSCDEERERARSCPYPSEGGAWDPNQWRTWLSGLQPGNIIVPAVSWQAWWTLISVLNGADRSGRAFDLQVKAVDEPFSAVLPEVDSVFI